MANAFPNPDFKIVVFTSPDEVPDEIERLKTLLRAGVDRIHIRKPGWSKEKIDALMEELPESLHDKCVRHPGDTKSSHSLAELATCPTDRRYQFLSPIFDSISKQGYLAAFDIGSDEGKTKLRDAISKATVPVYALGGVTVDKIPMLESLGFSGAAFLGEVWSKEGGYEDLLRYLRLRNGRLQFVTDATTPEETARQASQAISGGCHWVQIRMKDAEVSDVAETVKMIHSRWTETDWFTLIVDDHATLLSMPEVDGVHLGQEDVSPSDARILGDSSKIIGLTVNRPDQLIGNKYAEVDYYGIGPYRFTGTKKRLAPVLGIEGYRAINAEMGRIADKRPYVAIGGIKAADIPPLLEAGVPGIAVAGAIAHAENPIAATQNILKSMDSLTREAVYETSNARLIFPNSSKQ